MIVILTYFEAEFETECARFRPASTCLDHSLVVAYKIQETLFNVGLYTETLAQ